MQLHLRTGTDSYHDVYLDGLVIETILSTFAARDLAVLSQVCQTMRAPAQLAAHRILVAVVRRMQSSLLRHCERGSWIAQLREWEALEASNLVWLQANDATAILVRPGGSDERAVKHLADMSGHGNAVSSLARMPIFRPNAVNGYAAIEFDGSSVLKTRPFKQPLPQPVTIMVVARARGDTTIFDSLSPECAARSLVPRLRRSLAPPPKCMQMREKCMHPLGSAPLGRSSRFELCHGYPTGWHPSPEICMTASGQDQSPRQSLRGR